MCVSAGRRGSPQPVDLICKAAVVGTRMYVKICVTPELAKAGLLQSCLEAEGFHPLEVQTSPHAILAGADHAYYVEVPESEAMRARAWLAGNGYGADLTLGPTA